MTRRVLAVIAATALGAGGCASMWAVTQVSGKPEAWDESVREEAVPLPGLEERLVVSMPLVIEMTPAPAATATAGTTAPAPTPRPFALGCRSDQRGQDAVYRSAFRYGKRWKQGTAIMFLVEGASAAALLLLGDRSGSDVVWGGFFAVDAVATGALFFAPRKEIYRRDVRPVRTEIRDDCPATLTLQIGADVFAVDAAGRLGELGDLALDDWMQAPTGPLLLGFEGRSVELVITATDRCTWNRNRQRTPEPGCAYPTGISPSYASTTIDVAPGTLTRVIE